MIKKFYLKKHGENKLSENFTVKEFACKDGTDEILIDSDIVAFLQKIRYHFKKPIIITSAYRTVKYNKKIGGATSSYHCSGQAVDFYINNVNVKEIAKYCESIGINGIGCYLDDSFIHIDTRINKFYWYNQTINKTDSFTDINIYKYGIKKGHTGECIRLIQAILNKHNFIISIDGIYGNNTEKAIKTFQKNNNLISDGIIGYKTLKKLMEV